MKRRGFLKTLAGLFAAPAVPVGAWKAAGAWMVGDAAPIERIAIMPMPHKPVNTAFYEALRPGLEKVFGDEYRNMPDGPH